MDRYDVCLSADRLLDSKATGVGPIIPSLRDGFVSIPNPGNELPGYDHLVPTGPAEHTAGPFATPSLRAAGIEDSDSTELADVLPDGAFWSLDDGATSGVSDDGAKAGGRERLSQTPYHQGFQGPQ
jgi:hypothetical protein